MEIRQDKVMEQTITEGINNNNNNNGNKIKS